MKQNKTLFELQSEVCKTLASPKRLEILNSLKDGERTVSELVEILGVPKANVSQHLAVMRHKGILKTRREGVNIYYSVSNAKV
ncbi:MAG TPA: metalloregulator ArsR/SmtB family transcription factor, partial [Thermodesulfovibrionales bacterium]|nr:metalloregulator ArsR/SmtB family transcription factor [Thermodesulfovibrionales bacterium]